MQKRLLAILALVATVFAFGVGSALAENSAKADSTDKCETSGGKANGCENHPGEHEDDGDETGGETPDPQDLCEALGTIHVELQNACTTIVEALTGGGGDFPPEDFPPAPPEGGAPSCADIGESGLPAELAGPLQEGCEQLTEGGGEFPPEDFPPAPPEGGAPSCADIGESGLPAELAGPLMEACGAVTDALPAPPMI